MDKKVLLVILIYIVLSVKLLAQINIVSSGGDGSSDAGSISYSVGQVFYLHEKGNESISPGVQQPYLITPVTGIGIDNTLIEIQVYPNPVSHKITMKVKRYDNKILEYTLLNLNGVTLKKGKFDEDQGNIIMSDLPATTYVLHIFESNSLVSSYKIVKK